MRSTDSAISRAARGPRAAALVALVALASPSLAFAAPDDRSAARHFVDGQKAFTAGDYAHAGDEFEAAYRDKPHHAPLWNAARSWQRGGEEVRAANLYARYLREAPPDAPDRDQATAALRTLTSRLGRIELHAAGVEKLRLDGKPVEAPVLYVAAGEHVAEADDKGRAIRTVARVSAGELVSVTLAPEPRSAPLGPPPAPLPPGKPLSPIVPMVGGALTAAAGGFAIVSGLDTRSKRDEFLADRTQARLDDAFSSQTRTNVLIGTTAGLAVISGVIAIFFTDWSGGATTERGVVGAR